MCSVLCKLVILQLSLLVLCGSAEWLPCVNSSTAGPSSVSSEEQASVKGMTSDGAGVGVVSAYLVTRVTVNVGRSLIGSCNVLMSTCQC